MTISKDKNSQLERAVEKLANKCEILEGTINSLRNLFIAGNNSRKASLYDLNFSEFSSQTYKFVSFFLFLSREFRSIFIKIYYFKKKEKQRL